MFNKKFALLLTTIHSWVILLVAAFWILFSMVEAGNFYDSAEGVGFFIGMVGAGFVYLSIWYLAIYLIRKSINK